MDRMERFYKINYLLQDGKAVPFRKLMEELQVSPSTIKRDLEYMQTRFHAPIKWDRSARGYRFFEQKGPGPRYQLPGLWFNASEAHSLLTMQHLLENIEPGLLGQQLKPLQSRLHDILGSADYSIAEIKRRIRIIHIASRKAHLKNFEVVASAVLKRKRLHIKYFVRSRNEMTARDISPQRLVHYRDNWYLDAWCHLRKAVQTFSVDAIENVVELDTSAKKLSDAELDEILASGYGIFSGKNTTMATLRFNSIRARSIVLESWHPSQKGRMESDGSYVLQFPYSDDRELIGDILKFGADVEVINPPSLRNRVREQLRQAVVLYQ